MSKDGRRLIARDACSWCGHDRHADACNTTIRTQARPETNGPCPCTRRATR